VRAVAVVLGAALAGCASTVSHAPAEHCTAAIPPGMARIVATRSTSSMGGAAGIGVHDDGQPIGELGPGGRLCWLRHAGTAYVSAYITPQAPHTARDIDVKVAPGETVQLTIALGEPWKLVSVGR